MISLIGVAEKNITVISSVEFNDSSGISKKYILGTENTVDSIIPRQVLDFEVPAFFICRKSSFGVEYS